MGKNLKGKTAFIIAILVIFVYGIFGLPHGVSGTALKNALLERIHLGLDLKGGVHLVYKVHVEEAINTTSDRDVQRMQQDLATAGVTKNERRGGDFEGGGGGGGNSAPRAVANDAPGGYSNDEEPF